MKKAKGYVDCFLMVIPKKNIPEYKKIAKMFGEAMEKYGALEYREFIGDDTPKNMYPALMKVKRNEVLITSIVGFKSKKHREQINKKFIKDPKMNEMMEELNKKSLFDMSRMMYGGFKTIVEM